MKNWYIVQTFSGFEQKVAETLKDAINKKEQEFKDKIDRKISATIVGIGLNL